MTPRKQRLQQPQLVEPASDPSSAQLQPGPAQPSPAQFPAQPWSISSESLLRSLTSFHGNTESSPLISRARACYQKSQFTLSQAGLSFRGVQLGSHSRYRQLDRNPRPRADDASSSRCTGTRGNESNGSRLRGQTSRGSRFRFGGSRGPSQTWLLVFLYIPC